MADSLLRTFVHPSAKFQVNIDYHQCKTLTDLWPKLGTSGGDWPEFIKGLQVATGEIAGMKKGNLQAAIDAAVLKLKEAYSPGRLSFDAGLSKELASNYKLMGELRALSESRPARPMALPSKEMPRSIAGSSSSSASSAASVVSSTLQPPPPRKLSVPHPIAVPATIPEEHPASPESSKIPSPENVEDGIASEPPPVTTRERSGSGDFDADNQYVV